MENAVFTQESLASTEQGPRTREHDHRPRRRRNQGPSAPRNTSSTSAAVNARTSASIDQPNGHVPATSRGRGRGRSGRGPRNQTRGATGHRFGGHLTNTGNETASLPFRTSQALNADAPAFLPGQQPSSASGVPQSNSVPNQPRPQRRPSKSQAPDIATRIHEDINTGFYECPICTSEVRRNSKIWACHTCYTVFHLPCVKKWAKNQGSSAEQPQDGNIATRQWRCPGCNLPKTELPSAYLCWCGKQEAPRSLAGLPPHSCGNTCGGERGCAHPCEEICHAGKCPPCQRSFLSVCFCSKNQRTKRCSETTQEAGWSCSEPCGELLPCGHSCSRDCHEGLCGHCVKTMAARCYCGQQEKEMLCYEQGEEKESHAQSVHTGEPSTETWIGSFECASQCNHLYDCGVHRCESKCHSHATMTSHCPMSPDVVDSCPCGRMALRDLKDTPRQTCADSIPSCLEQCAKSLPCGHNCTAICHAGPCPSCMKAIQIKCRCGRTNSASVCHQGKLEHPQCMRVCRTPLNCGRHACDERCCTGERKAIERSSTKRKQRPLSSTARAVDQWFEAEHICTRQCNRALKCGVPGHYCEDLCHRGMCGTCREAIFEELSCHCGRTVLHPPLPCGTEQPPCKFSCSRARACGHPQVPHACHLDDEACLSCPFLTEKRCACKKTVLKNQQCWLQDVSCGKVCGAKLKCGSHFDRKLCHRPGECEDAKEPCSQLCGKEKKSCGHPDLEHTCHAPFPCKEDKPCSSITYITCECQTQKQEMKCGVSRTSKGNTSKTILCNEECARLERNRKLALALNIDQSTHVEGHNHIPFSNTTLELYAQRPDWAQTQEREFRVFAGAVEEKRLRFQPMPAQRRAFIHALAEDFGFDSESMDPEPHRHVMVWKTPRFVAPPNKIIADALRIRRGQQSASASAPLSDTEPSKTSKLQTVRKPYNGIAIANPPFGLTIDNLRQQLDTIVHPQIPFALDIHFLPHNQVVLTAKSSSLGSLDLEAQLHNIKPSVVAALWRDGCGTAELCSLDELHHIVRLESDASSADGWSTVAAKKAAPRSAALTSSIGGCNSFSALEGNKVTFSKKKPSKPKPKKQEAVVDDWESALSVEEEQASTPAVSTAAEGSDGM